MSLLLRSIIARLGDRLQVLYGDRLARLVLFGSQARGEAEPGSDIDVLVVLHGPVNPGEEIARTGPIAVDLSLQHDVVISCTFVSHERFVGERSPLLLNIHREGVTL